MNNQAEISLNLFMRGQIEGILALVEAQINDGRFTPEEGNLAECFASALKLLKYPTEDINYWGREYIQDIWTDI